MTINQGQDNEIPKFFEPLYARNAEMLLQKEQSYLRPLCEERGDYTGDGAQAVKQFGSTKAIYGDDDRTGDTPVLSTPRDVRWLYPAPAKWGDLISKDDLLRQLIDPTSWVHMAGVMAMNRSIDEDVIIPAFFGTAKTGKNGTTSTTFPSSQEVAITVGSSDGNTNTGLNTAKLIRARKLLRKAYVKVTQEPIFCAISAAQEEDLLNDAKVINRDYNPGDPGWTAPPVLRDGQLDRWLGMNFVVLEELPFDPADATKRWNPVWAKSGMHLGVWDNFSAFFAPDPTKQFNYRVFMRQTFAATRTQEKKVVKIINLDNG